MYLHVHVTAVQTCGRLTAGLLDQHINHNTNFMIVMGNIPSSVALHENHAKVFINMLNIKCQILVLNLNMPKNKWEGAEDPTINNFLKNEIRKF